jgi:hypothetical protein
MVFSRRILVPLAPRFCFYVAPCTSSSFLLTRTLFIWLITFFWVCCLFAPCSSCRLSRWCFSSPHICIAMVVAICFYRLRTLCFSTKDRRAAGAGQNDVICCENKRSKCLIGTAHAAFSQIKLASPSFSWCLKFTPPFE